MYEVCVQLGYCLRPEQTETILANPPADADVFVDAVLIAEGQDPDGVPAELRDQLLDLVAGLVYDDELPTFPPKGYRAPSRTHRPRRQGRAMNDYDTLIEYHRRAYQQLVCVHEEAGTETETAIAALQLQATRRPSGQPVERSKPPTRISTAPHSARPSIAPRGQGKNRRSWPQAKMARPFPT